MTDLRVSFPKPCTENWADMRAEGCNRHCARCDHIIHDLSQLTFDEAEELARSSHKTCVRAELGGNGILKLKPGGRSRRRMIAAIGASAGLLATNTQLSATGTNPLGAIKGKVMGTCGFGSVVAVATDGRTYHAKIRSNGRYKVRRLPAGSYELQVDQQGAPKIGPVIVEAGRTTKAENLADTGTCIIIGMIDIDDHNG